MTPEQFIKLEETIASQIRTTVNGKIDRLQASVDKTDVKLNVYINEDNQWKEDVKPYIENMRQISNFSSVGSTILKFIVILGSATTVIWAAIKYLKY